jgi:hypothetical protein
MRTTQGFISFKALVVLCVVAGLGIYFMGSIRDWGQDQFATSQARTQEFDRRVKAQRHAAKPELAQAGIHIEAAPAPLDSSAGTAEADVPRPTLKQRVRSLWYRLRGAPPIELPPIPVLRDSLGLLPGERVILPNGRVVEYDTTTFTYQRPAGNQ